MKPAESSLVDLVRDIIDIDGRVERNPYGMMAGAVGAGFILGGGLFTRLTGRIAGAALRIGVMAALPRLEKEFGCWMGRTAEAAGPSSETIEKGQ
jgi:hypothetical protein